MCFYFLEKPSPPDFYAICAESKVTFTWISGFDGGDKQIFHVIASFQIEKSDRILSSIADKGFGTHNKLSVDMEPGRYTFYIFANNSYGGVNSSTTVCSVVGNVNLSLVLILFICLLYIGDDKRNNCLMTEIRQIIILVTNYFLYLLYPFKILISISLILTLAGVNIYSYLHQVYATVKFLFPYFSSFI